MSIITTTICDACIRKHGCRHKDNYDNAMEKLRNMNINVDGMSIVVSCEFYLDIQATAPSDYYMQRNLKI